MKKDNNNNYVRRLLNSRYIRSPNGFIPYPITGYLEDTTLTTKNTLEQQMASYF
jgi:hypothetical protein